MVLHIYDKMLHQSHIYKCVIDVTYIKNCVTGKNSPISFLHYNKSTMNTILIIDDDIDICFSLSKYLNKHGYETETAQRGSTGVEKFTKKNFDIVITDFRLGDTDGREVLKKIKAINPNTIVIIITAYIDVKIAIDVVKFGAFYYLMKPMVPEEMLNLISDALQQQKTNGTIPLTITAVSHQEIASSPDDEYMKSNSPEARAVQKQIDVIAPTNYSVIIYGQSGTGKEVAARTIHNNSKRKEQPFIAMDCGTLTKELAGSELFGHEKGAFTGAINSKIGHFELANGGTLFLDEVANLPLNVQISLLRVCQERKIRRVGGVKEIDVDVRLIIASNENLMDACRKGKFREDLYHRFNEFCINLPSLKTSKDDIIEFANFFLTKTNIELGKKIEGFDARVTAIFQNYSWPGNLRELRNIVRRAALLTDKRNISVSSLPLELRINTASDILQNETDNSEECYTAIKLKSATKEAEYGMIKQVLKQVNYNRTKAARLMNIDRKTLYNKIKSYAS